MYADTWPRGRESSRVRVFAVACIVAREVEGRMREIVIRRNCNFSLTRAMQPLARRVKAN